MLTDTLVHDIRYALRMLGRHPAFSVVSIAAMALGIGANSAIFTIVNGILLRPLPYADPDRIVVVRGSTAQESDDSYSAADFLDLQAQNRVFSHIAAHREGSVSLTGAGEPERLSASFVTADFFGVCAVRPVAGRLFGRIDARADRPRMVVVSRSLWQRRLDAERAPERRTIRLDGVPYVVAGVVPDSSAWPKGADLWILSQRAVPPSPIGDAGTTETDREVQYLNVIARLKPDASLAAARAAMSVISRRLERQYPEDAGRTIRLIPLHEFVVGNVRTPLLVLLASVGFVLLIACTNVANLLLARAAGRHREIAIRNALGAGRRRLIRQLLTESMVMSLLGGLLGLLVARWAIDLLLIIAPDDIPRLSEVTLDARVLGFTLVLSLITGALFGIAPAIQTSSSSPGDALQEGSTRSGMHPARRRLRHLLIVSEIALSLMLLAGAGLMVRSFLQLRQVDPGFDPNHVAAIGLPLPESKYGQSHQQTSAYERVLERARHGPGAPAVALAFPVPLAGSGRASASFIIERRPKLDRRDRPVAALNIVSDGYFRVMGIPLIKGHDFSGDEIEGVGKVMLVNHSLARRFWPDSDPIGSRINIGTEESAEWFTIIGVVGDVRPSALSVAPSPELYISYRQLALPFLSIMMRSNQDLGAVTAAIRSAVRSFDPDLPIGRVTTMERVVSNSVSETRFQTSLILAFALTALILAMIGVYGVISYSVTERVREIGIRLALGAGRSDVLALILFEGLGGVGLGVVIGLALSWAATRVLSTLLYNITPTDPMTFLTVTLVLAGTALLASYLPARRAMNVDPIVALRYE